MAFHWLVRAVDAGTSLIRLTSFLLLLILLLFNFFVFYFFSSLDLHLEATVRSQTVP